MEGGSGEGGRERREIGMDGDDIRTHVHMLLRSA